MNKTKVLLADDHALVRQGLRALIDAMPDAEVIAEASNGHEALAAARRLDPDVALLDIAMPQLNGIETAARLSQECPRTKVVMLSMHTTAQYVTAAIRAGALGYVIKDAAVDDLAQALREAAQGRSYVSVSVSGHLVQALQRPSVTPGLDQLSSRQREILQMIAEGHSTRGIGELLHISPKTVETHRAELMRRLGIHDVAGLTRYAIREGLVSNAG
ncbi:response regulator containing a CheY-like receiver domain and an HTH DNA-binding domain [Burkholderiales bacterium JOSHI_001]|nr:response regulator containing a CheY-like receiver domain and an HTH DNA-binding domain [Burkholderiales bacterium JOSHI_001]